MAGGALIIVLPVKRNYMVRLFHGTDTFRIYERVAEIKKDYDKLSIVVFEEGAGIDKVKQEADTLSFFSPKKLIIAKNVSKIKDKSQQKIVLAWLDQIDSSLEIIFIEEEELKPNNWLLVTLKKTAEMTLCNQLKPYEVTRWIQERVKKRSGEIDIICAEKLTQMLGNDLWRISNELDKLISYDKKITAKSIESLVEPEFLDSIFSLMDAISEKKEKKALVILDKFLKEEGNETYLISMIARQIRNLISIKDLAEDRKKETEIASKLKLHPFVVKNTLRQSRNLSFSQLLAFHEALLEADIELKSSTDSKTTLFRLVHNFCAK